MNNIHITPLLVPALALILSGCTGDEIFVTDEAIAGESSSLADPGLAWSESAFEATIGADNVFPEITNTHGLSISYSSSDTAVATIDDEGNITLVSAGTTAIMATSAATSTYAAGSDSYALTVLKGENGIYWSATSCTVNIDDETHDFPTLSNTGNQTVSYSSSNEGVATVDTDGTVILVAEGSTTIVANAEENDSYEAASASYDLTVEGSLIAAGLSWSESSCTATLASGDNVYPTLSNPNGLAVSYASSDEGIATIDEDGNITLVAAGTTSIIASSEADETYASGSASYTLKVVKNTVTLSWSASVFSVVLEDGADDYPTLSIDPSDAGIAVSYASSNTSVATIDSDGNITLVGVGNATISATFEGNGLYKAASASYTLTVTTAVDDGAVTTIFDSAGGGTSDDDISNTTFTRLVTVTYASGGASVTGHSAVADVMSVSVSGNQVTIAYSGSENVVYKLTGAASDGFFKLTSSKKQALWLKGLTLTCSSGAAINNQSGKRTFVYVEGTNTLADGSGAAYSTSGDEDMKAVFFSEGQLIFSGSGSLKVTANNNQEKSGIASDDYVRVLNSPSITVSAGTGAGHGIRGKEYVQLTSGSLNITTAAAKKKGITSEDYVLVDGGTHTIKVTGGTAYDSEDAEYKGSAGIKADNYFAMTGGTVTITNSGAGGKGIRAGSYDYDSTNHTVADSYISGGTLTITTTGNESNDVSAKGMKIGWAIGSENRVTANDGSLIISGGVIKVSSSKSEGIESKDAFTMTGGELYVTSTGDDAVNCVGEMEISGGYIYANSSKNDALDSNGNMTLSGGYIFAVTTAGDPEVAIDCAEQKTLTIANGVTMVAYPKIESGANMSQTCYTMSCTAGSWNALYGSSYIAAFKAPSGVSSVVVSAPSLSKGYKSVSVSGTTYCNGVWATSGISGGSSVTLSTYNGGSSGPGGGPGGGGGGGRP